jgi:predicted site-specific integrase-resolvase
MDDWITQLEAADLRGVAVQVVNNWVRRGRIRTKERYGKVLVSRGDVLGYESQKPGPKPKAKPGQSNGKKRGKK